METYIISNLKARSDKWWYRSWIKWHRLVIYLFPKSCDCIYTLEIRDKIIICRNCGKIYDILK